METRTLIMSVEDGKNLKSPKNSEKKNYVKLKCVVTQSA